MIDPSNVINYHRTADELQEFILFCVMVPGHNAQSTAAALDKFLTPAFKLELSPFEYVRQLIKSNQLLDKLKINRIGCYGRISKCLKELIELDITNLSVDILESIYGIGPKTARYIITYTQRNVKDIAILDVHILQYLREQGFDVPTATPSGNKYKQIEKLFVDLANKSGKTIAEFDLDIWTARRKLIKKNP